MQEREGRRQQEAETKNRDGKLLMIPLSLGTPGRIELPQGRGRVLRAGDGETTGGQGAVPTSPFPPFAGQLFSLETLRIAVHKEPLSQRYEWPLCS